MADNIDVDEILKKYGSKIESQINAETEAIDVSRDFLAFKRDALPELSRYERLCQSIGSIIKIRIAKKDGERLQRKIDIAHLDIAPSQAASLALLSLLLVFLLIY